MSRPKGTFKTPTYREHKASGQAVTTISGKTIYLGKFGTPDSRAKYHRLLGEWHLSGGTGAPVGNGPEGVTIAELIVAYWAELQRKGKTGTMTHSLSAIKMLRRLYGDTLAADFGPLALKALRREMIRTPCVCGRGKVYERPEDVPPVGKHQRPRTGKRAGLTWSRSHINELTRWLMKMFRWADSDERIPKGNYQRLLSVEPLIPGEDGVRESGRVLSVPTTAVTAVLPHLTPILRAMVRLQLLSGMRSGEVCIMRGVDIDASGDLWVYKPSRHKTMMKGRTRAIPLGKQCQEIIRPFLKGDPDAYLFSPLESHQARMRARLDALKEEIMRHVGEHGLTSVTRLALQLKRGVWRVFHAVIALMDEGRLPPDVIDRTRSAPRTPPPPSRKPRHFTTGNYSCAIQLACKRAGIPPWHPHQLRHAAAMEVTNAFGEDAARALLGHSKVKVTKGYLDDPHSDTARRDLKIAGEVMSKVG